ncbi:transposase domain-containing protein [Streptomyces sp. NPDC088560]|uniref:transposase domain-containing protein n=1 Tax=Streptomyces sp. NPDC088560 TaxID=3365868 RepID=UPI003821C60D
MDAVLDESEARERRLRSLPSRVGVHFVLALGLFGHLGTGLVWGQLGAGLAARVPQPSEKALRDLRRQVGLAPLKRLFHVLAGPLAQLSTPGVRYRRRRTVAFDGCGSLSVPDHERNRSWLGRTERRYGPTGHPRLMLMTLCETGTRGLTAAVFGPASTGETDRALRAEQPLRLGETHRSPRSARAAPRAPYATVRSHRQVRNLPLQHLEPRRPSTRQYPDHRRRDHRAPTSPAQHTGPKPGPLRSLGPGLPALGHELQPGHAHPGHRTASRAPHLGAPTQQSHRATLLLRPQRPTHPHRAKHLQDHSP